MSPSRAGVRVVGSGAPDDGDDNEGHEADDAIVVTSTPDDAPVRTVPPVVVIILAILVLAGLFGSVFFWGKYRHLSDNNSAINQVRTTSNAFLTSLFNFQANTIDADFNKIEAFATGDFATQALSFFSSDVRKELVSVQAVSRGQISSLYVQSVSGNQAVTFADIDQSIANMNFKSPELDEVRVVLNLVKVSSAWKISEVTVLQAPSVPSGSSPLGGAAPTTTTPTTAAP